MNKINPGVIVYSKAKIIANRSLLLAKKKEQTDLAGTGNIPSTVTTKPNKTSSQYVLLMTFISCTHFSNFIEEAISEFSSKNPRKNLLIEKNLGQ